MEKIVYQDQKLLRTGATKMVAPNLYERIVI